MSVQSLPLAGVAATIIKEHGDELLDEWMASLAEVADLAQAGPKARPDAAEFLRLLVAGLAESAQIDLQGTEWRAMREFLVELSNRQAEWGFSPVDTAEFLMALKRPLASLMQRVGGSDGRWLESWQQVNQVIDRWALYTMEVVQANREATIRRQQQEMLELSTPVIQLWDGITAVPLIGTLDSERTQTVMESLLTSIVENHAEIAIIDITGVPTVDTLVAQHLLKTVAAARLMGAECIISGVRPTIAQTIVHLGIDIGSVATKASLADALKLAFRRRGCKVESCNQ
ncbi:MAG: STAS domain-containing protein [Planctomycetota bacterium]|nr:MAG: STAS domain-containing protein [Planctomycetota bacterium]